MSEKQSSQAPVKQRRIGTFTMGAAMILTGVALVCWMMGWLNEETFFVLCRFSPLLLVGAGLEMCIYGAAGDKVQFRYDFVSVIFCGILLFLTLGLSTLAMLASHYPTLLY